jgi:hypothetical protein
MNKIDNFGKVIQDMSLLYELALATGQSLDLKESCDLFLKRLMGRKNLSYSVWIKDNFLTGEEYQQTTTLIYAFPEFFPKSKKLPLDHPLFTCLNKEKIVKVSSNKKEFWQLVDEKGITTEMENAGEAWEDHGLVFCNELGQPLCPRGFTRNFERVLKRAGMEKITFHGLRHTFATMSLQEGVSIKTTQKNLGHHKAAFTLDVYSSVTSRMKKEATDKIGSLLASCMGK